MASPVLPEGTVPDPGTLTALLLDLARLSMSPEVPSAPRVGETVAGRFEVIREIGRGGFGVVLEAHDTALDRPVALKFFRRAGPVSAPAPARVAEADAIARLSHPSIVQIFDRGTCDAGPFLVPELLDGEPLSKLLGRERLPVDRAVRLALDIAHGLAHAHVRGVVHRDLKPSNVFVCADGRAKLLDFGLAHLVGRPGGTTGGTPGWMAPEQRKGGAGDERSDVWALGRILFRLLAGRDPVGGRLRVSGAPELEALVDTMLAEDPAARPRDAAHVVEALEPIARRLEASPAVAPNAPDAVQARAWPWRRVGLLAVVVAGLAASSALWWRSTHRAAPETPSVAVLPFADLSPGKDQVYFADGIAEEILNGLTQVDGLRVVGRTTAFSYRGKDKKAEEIGRELSVGTVLEGSVRKSGDRVRIQAQLVHTRNASTLWSGTFERSLSDVFAVQDEISRAVVEALRIRLLPGTGVARNGGTTDAEALQLYLVGKGRMRSGDAKRALEAFEKAAAVDPQFALAWVGIANAIIALHAATNPPEAGNRPGRERALVAANRAVDLAPRLSDAFLARADVHLWLENDWQGQRADLERARGLAPGDPALALSFGFFHQVNGDLDQAISEFERATRMEPLVVQGWMNGWLALGAARLSRGDHEEARVALHRALEVFPGYEEPRWGLGMDFISAGQPELALAEAARFKNEGYYRLGLEVLAYHDLGRPRESQAALDELIPRFAADAAYQIAEMYAWRGDPDRAFEWLEKARTQRDTAMFWLKTDPLLRKIRGDPRYAALVRKIDGAAGVSAPTPPVAPTNR